MKSKPRRKSEYKKRDQDKRSNAQRRRKEDIFNEQVVQEVDNHHLDLQFQEEDNTAHWNLLLPQIEEDLANLGEKRDKSVVSREESLQRILNCLKHTFVPDFIQTRKSEFLRVLKQGLSSGIVREQVLSSSLLSLLCITCGTSWKPLFETLSQTMIQYILKSDHFEVRSAYLEAFCICCFVWVEEYLTKSCLGLLEQIIVNEEKVPVDKDTSCFFQSVLDMWCLIMTLVEDETIVDEFIPSHIGGIVDLLSSDDINVRLAAGEALALLCNTVAKTEEGYTPYFWNGYFEVEEIVYLLQSTDAHQQRKINKKDREKQRHGFKDTLAALEEGTSPRVTMVINGQHFSFYDWKSIKRLSSFRHLLGTGFHTHMQYNSLLSDIFNIRISQERPTVLKSEKKTSYGSKCSRGQR